MSIRQPRAKKPELIVKLKAGSTPALSASLWSTPGGLQQSLATWDAILEPIAPRSPGFSAQFATSPTLQEAAHYFRVRTDTENLEAIRSDLEGMPGVEAAYIKPPAETAARPFLQLAVAALEDGPTPDFSARQHYLVSPPDGVGIQALWALPGGRGHGVRIIDCEWTWNFAHEDLLEQSDGVLVGSMNPTDDEVDHGTAVAGILIGTADGLGVTGIAPASRLGAAVLSINETQATSKVIMAAARMLGPGDVLLLEVHRAGPNAPEPRQGQLGYIAIEWWPDDLTAIQFAVARGIVVVEAAGNGSEDLDTALYDTPQAGFPGDWRNPFGKGGPSSGAILVGAGMPPFGTHGRTGDPDMGDHYAGRSRCSFSNFGERVDCQAWGYEVTTTAYGDLFNGGPDRLYTDRFAGTSSASPIVAGIAACLEGALKAGGKAPLTSTELRDILRNSGTPQTGAAEERIGALPDCVQLISAVGLT